MVDISLLNNFCEAAVEACPSLGDHILVSSEAELKDAIGQVKVYPLLVVVLPESKGDDHNYDNYAESNSGLFYIVKPLKENFSKQQRLDVWTTTQKAMQDFKKFIMEQMVEGDFMDMLKDADWGKRDQQPEYNLMGCSGWSLNFDYSTDGL
jgi:hypothetical protein